MTKNFHRLAVLVFLSLGSAASAQSPHGEATLSGSERFAVRGCGRSGAPVVLDFTIEPLACIASVLPCPDDGAWTLAGAAAPLTGLSRGGPRGARLRVDAQSLAALEAALEARASAQCGEPIDLRSLSANAAIVISKKGEQARLLLHARARATNANGEGGRAIYRVRARGAWTPPPAQ